MVAAFTEELLVGWCRLVRPLAPGPLGERWLALHQRDHSSHVVHRIPIAPTAAGQRRFLAAAEAVAAVPHPHLLPIEYFTLGGRGPEHHAGFGLLVTPYTGAGIGTGIDATGLITLRSHLALKRQIPPAETERALHQLLLALERVHAAGLHHGPLSLDEVLVDRFGKAVLELWGLKRQLHRHHDDLPGYQAPLARQEIRSVAAIAYELLVGRPASADGLPPSTFIRNLDPAWDRWFAAGLSAEFVTARAALQQLPSLAPADPEAEESLSPLRVLLRTLIGPLVRRDS